MRAREFITESVNPDILNKKFRHTQVIGDYTYTADVEIFLDEPLLNIKAYDGDKEIGHILFEIYGYEDDPANGYLESGGTEVDPKYRNKGVASTMYAYAKMLGNDIRPSWNRTAQGKGMWAAWEKSGDAKHLMPEPVNELFQSGKNWKWDFTGSEEAMAEFTVGKVNYMFHAYGADGQWEAEFKVNDKKMDRLQKFGLTGTGNSAEVMSTVVDIMRSFLEKYRDQIEVLTFSAEEDSRQGLYARMIKRLLPNWTMRLDGKYFTLIAPKQSVTESNQPRAAGCIVVAEDTGRWCLQQRSDQVSDPGVWSTWGGGVEPGETLEQAVLRELAEEGGYHGPARLKHVHTSPQYATYIAFVPNEFEPEINYESKDWCWADQDQLPEPLHPGLEEALSKLNENFHNGKKPGRKGLAKRMGVNCKQSVSKLRSIAKNSSGERQRMAHWCANMKSGRNK